MKTKIRESNPMEVKKGEAAVAYVIMIAICLVALFPIVWVIISSFKEDIMASPGFDFPKSIYIAGYIKVFTKLGIGKYSYFPWKFTPPAKMFGQGSPLKLNWEPSVPPRIG